MDESQIKTQVISELMVQNARDTEETLTVHQAIMQKIMAGIAHSDSLEDIEKYAQLSLKLGDQTLKSSVERKIYLVESLKNLGAGTVDI